MNEGPSPQAGPVRHRFWLGRALRMSKVAQSCELAIVFLVPLALLKVAEPLFGESPISHHAAVSLAIVFMIVLVWLGLRLRGQTWTHFGLIFRLGSRRTIIRTFLQSLIALVGAVAAFIVAAIVMANIVGIPDQPEMSGYDYLRGNLPMLILSLLAVYITASFGEEVIYRAFLINRIAEFGSGSKGAWRLAVVLSSVAFGLAHGDWGLAGMVQTGCMGLALGVSYLVVRRNLWVTILAHGYMDTILMLQLYLAGGTEA